MGKKSKRRSGGGKKPTANTQSAAVSIDDSSVKLEQARAYLSSLPEDGYNSSAGCTNGELLQRVHATQKAQSHKRTPPGWRPQTADDWRHVLDSHMDYYSMLRLTQADEPLHNTRLTFFREYAFNLIQNICGLTNREYRENYIAGGIPEAEANSRRCFPGAPPDDTLFPVTAKDKQFLRSIVKARESPIYVAHADLALGFLYKFLEHNRHKGCAHFQKSVEVCDAVTEEQKRKDLPSPLDSIHMSDGTALPFRTVGDYLAYVRTMADTQVKVGRSISEMVVGSSGSCMPGEECDGCGKAKSSLGGKQLLICSRCRRAYYCSKECQIAHWKQTPNRHKQTCRKKGEFRKGNHAKTMQKFGVTPVGNTVVLVEKQDGDNKWLVESLYDDDQCVLSEDQLRVIPPHRTTSPYGHGQEIVWSGYLPWWWRLRNGSKQLVSVRLHVKLLWDHYKILKARENR